ncbi:MAG: hypothetical protein PHG29_11215 [Prolixibacteraceae bacterium]|nr:hypothetical protein [Prolixibacteraceae bacterium]
MKLDLIANSKNDEFYTPRYAITPLIKYLKPRSTILCPFDTKNSLFVKILKDNGFNVNYSHINNNINFFELDLDNIECDYIISNPPYSLKNEVFEKLFNSNKSFAMLVGVVGLFESKKRFNLFKNNNFEIMYFDKRISYFKDYRDEKPSLNPPFSSVYLTRGILPKKIIFEELNKSLKGE